MDRGEAVFRQQLGVYGWWRGGFAVAEVPVLLMSNNQRTGCLIIFLMLVAVAVFGFYLVPQDMM